MGNVRRTIQNLEVVATDEEKNLLFVRGSVPGHKGTFLVVRHAKKIPPKPAEKTNDEGKK